MSDVRYEPYKPIDWIPEEVQACFPPVGPIHQYLWWATQVTDAPAIFHLAAVMPVLARETALRGWRVDDNRLLVPLSWNLIVGPSASGKSTAMRMVKGFYHEVLRAAERQDEPFLTLAGTMPGVYEELATRHDHERSTISVVLFREEFIDILSKYKKEDWSDTLNEWADGGHMERHLKSDKKARQRGETVNDKLRDLAASALLATTYDKLASHTKREHLIGGLLSRIGLVAAETPIDKLKAYPTPQPEARRGVLGTWHGWICWLDATELTMTSQRIVSVTPDVVQLLTDSLFENFRAHMAQDDPLNPARKRALSRALVYAGLFALSCNRTMIAAEDMTCAINFVELEIRCLGRMAPTIGGSFLVQAIDRAFHFVVSKGISQGASRTELYRFLQLPKNQLDAVVETLIDEGSVVQKTQRTGRRGRPTITLHATGPARFMSVPEASTGYDNVVAFPGTDSRD